MTKRPLIQPAALLLLGLMTMGGSLLQPSASAHSWDWNDSIQDYPESNSQTYGERRSRWRKGTAQARSSSPIQQEQRCNAGRLLGGLGGGALAYAISRDEGRAWAIPLGALLGSQVGCNAAVGRNPTPW
ncbi:MAG: hypothetical protein ACO23X_03430 [Vulcanococcus sp.]|jgi:hypothetical protein